MSDGSGHDVKITPSRKSLYCTTGVANTVLVSGPDTLVFIHGSLATEFNARRKEPGGITMADSASWRLSQFFQLAWLTIDQCVMPRTWHGQKTSFRGHRPPRLRATSTGGVWNVPLIAAA